MRPARAAQFTVARTARPVADETLMRAALAVARRGLLAGEAPVGACIVQDGRVIASAHTAVAGGPDATRARRDSRHPRCLSQPAQRAHSPAASCTSASNPVPCVLRPVITRISSEVFFAASLQDMQAVTGQELLRRQPQAMVSCTVACWLTRRAPCWPSGQRSGGSGRSRGRGL